MSSRRLDVMRQRSEQNFTFSQSRAHFFRHAKGRPQTAQSFVGRFNFECAIRRERGISVEGVSQAMPSVPAEEVGLVAGRGPSSWPKDGGHNGRIDG